MTIKEYSIQKNIDPKSKTVERALIKRGIFDKNGLPKPNQLANKNFYLLRISGYKNAPGIFITYKGRKLLDRIFEEA